MRRHVRAVTVVALLCLGGMACGSSSDAPTEGQPDGAAKGEDRATAQSVCTDYGQLMLGERPVDETGQWVVDGLERVRRDHASGLRSIPALKSDLDSAIAEQRANVAAKQGPIDALDRFGRTCEPFMNIGTSTTR